MADERGEMDINSRGTDWEVISLTASTYAAAPGPRGFDPTLQHEKEVVDKTEPECSDPMLRSKHSIFAPHELTTPPAENYYSEIHKEQNILDERITRSQEFNEYIGHIDLSTELQGNQLFDMGCNLSDPSKNLRDEGKEDLKIVETENAFFVSPNYGLIDNEADTNDISGFCELRNPSQEKFAYPPLRASKAKEETNNEVFDNSTESWWKKRAMSVYNHAKGTNSFWSFFVVVAVAGLVFLGQRWTQKSQFQQFKWKLNGAGEKINKTVEPVSQYKALVGGNCYGGSRGEGLHTTF